MCKNWVFILRWQHCVTSIANVFNTKSFWTKRSVCRFEHNLSSVMKMRRGYIRELFIRNNCWFNEVFSTEYSEGPVLHFSSSRGFSEMKFPPCRHYFLPTTSSKRRDVKWESFRCKLLTRITLKKQVLSNELI